MTQEQPAIPPAPPDAAPASSIGQPPPTPSAEQPPSGRTTPPTIPDSRPEGQPPAFSDPPRDQPRVYGSEPLETAGAVMGSGAASGETAGLLFPPNAPPELGAGNRTAGLPPQGLPDTPPSQDDRMADLQARFDRLLTVLEGHPTLSAMAQQQGLAEPPPPEPTLRPRTGAFATPASPPPAPPDADLEARVAQLERWVQGASSQIHVAVF